MALFKNAKVAKDVEQVEDRVGGGFEPLESGVYLAVITNAYVIESSRGSSGVHLELKIPDEKDRIITQDIYITNTDGDTFYEKDGKNYYLQGYQTMDAIALITTDTPILEQDSETRTVEVYNRETKTKERVKKEVLVDMLQAEINVGIIKAQRYKQVETSPGSGEYRDTDDLITYNEIDKIFDPEQGMTVNELMEEAEEAVFINQWLARWEGKVKEARKKAAPPARKGAGGGARSTRSAPASSSAGKTNRFARK